LLGQNEGVFLSVKVVVLLLLTVCRFAMWWIFNTKADKENCTICGVYCKCTVTSSYSRSLTIRHHFFLMVFRIQTYFFCHLLNEGKSRVYATNEQELSQRINGNLYFQYLLQYKLNLCLTHNIRNMSSGQDLGKCFCIQYCRRLEVSN
jgi:hypothetical protein